MPRQNPETQDAQPPENLVSTPSKARTAWASTLGRPKAFVAGFTIALIGGTALWLNHAYQTRQAALPNPDNLLAYAQPNSRTLKAQDGSILLQVGASLPENPSLATIPPQLVQAFVAAEDRRFYEHSGVDPQSILRAILANLQAGETVEGGSTITQQLARIVFLNQDRNLDRKISEALMARRIEASYTKDQILERYLNLVYLGSGAYGVTDAAWIYFGKTLDELTLAEMATIAGMPPAPSVYSPLINPDLAQRQRNKVLQRMADQGYISQAEADATQAEPLTVNPSEPKYSASPFPYFTSFIQKELDRLVTENEISADTLAQGGLVIETTLNPDWQTIAQDTLRHIVDRDGYYERFDQGALVIIDPHTGAIPVMVGGMDFESSEFNRVTQAHRQPGSTFKTFVYTAAIAGGLSPYQTYVDAPLTVDGYTPKNYGGNFRGSISMRDALTHSVNIVALKVLLDVGFSPVIQLASNMGIGSELNPTYSLSLGASEVTLLELTSAYGTLANRGQHIPSYGISRILNREGQLIFDASHQPRTQAVDEETAAIVTWMLQSVVDQGTGRAASLKHPVAGKTGTSEGARDLWFVGYLPQLVAGVWLGNDDNSRTWGSSGTAAYLWGEVMRQITADLPVEDFPPLPTLEGREGIIALEPIKPNRISQEAIQTAQESFEGDDSGERYQDDYREDPTIDSSGDDTADLSGEGDLSGEDQEAGDRGEGDAIDPPSGTSDVPPDGVPLGNDAPMVDPVYPADTTDQPPAPEEPLPLPDPVVPPDQESI